MAYLNRDLAEIELDREREKFRRSSLGCEGYTVGVCAALLCMVSAYSGKTTQEIGSLSGSQLWSLAGAGFKATLKLPDLPMPVREYLCSGERLAIIIGLCALRDSLPTGGCLGEIYESAGVDIAKLRAIISGAVKPQTAELI